MPRIAHVISTPSGVGGAERVLHALVAGGGTRSWVQAVFNPFAASRDSGLGVLLGQSVTYSERVTASVAAVPGAFNWLRRGLSAFQPDLVHAHLFHALVLTAGIPRGSERGRIVTHHHGRLFEGQRGALNWLDRTAVARYDAVVAVSSSVSAWLSATYEISPTVLTTIPNGWSGEPRAKEAGNPPTAVFVGNFRPEKRHNELLRIMAEVSRSLPEARLKLLGSGPLQEEVADQASDLGMESQVDILGFVEDVWSVLASASVFVSAAYESFGIAALEAMAAGVPLVVYERSVAPELVINAETGFVLPNGDVDGMAAAVVRVLTDAGLQQTMGFAAARHAAKFTVAGMVSRYFELYEELLGLKASS